jgi:hypothetical protein
MDAALRGFYGDDPVDLRHASLVSLLASDDISPDSLAPTLTVAPERRCHRARPTVGTDAVGSPDLLACVGAERIRTPDPLDAKGHFMSVPVTSSSMVSEQLSIPVD